MKALAVGLLIASVAGATSVLAKSPKNSGGAAELQQALGAVAATATQNPAAQGAGTPPKTEDNDQGDDHANPGAILKVCSKDMPAAQRAAICPVGVSPD
jgi:hypothetical protein